MSDGVVFGALVVGLATLLGAHLALVGALASRGSLARAALALIVPPHAPFWGVRAGLRVRAGLWVVALAAYLVALALGSR